MGGDGWHRIPRYPFRPVPWSVGALERTLTGSPHNRSGASDGRGIADWGVVGFVDPREGVSCPKRVGEERNGQV